MVDDEVDVADEVDADDYENQNVADGHDVGGYDGHDADDHDYASD